MSEATKELAQEHAELAARQAGYAASNIAEAAEHAKDHAVELIGFNFRTHSTPIAIASGIVATGVTLLAIHGGRTIVKDLKAKRELKKLAKETP